MADEMDAKKVTEKAEVKDDENCVHGFLNANSSFMIKRDKYSKIFTDLAECLRDGDIDFFDASIKIKNAVTNLLRECKVWED